MNRKMILTGLLLWQVVLTISAQNTANNRKMSSKIDIKKGPNEFPELINAIIPGAPKLGKPQLIMGSTSPVKGEGMGWAAPAIYDWNQDGLNDLLIGEFGSGMENKGMNAGNFIRVYENKGTQSAPGFSDAYSYAYGQQDEVHALGTPLSIYTWCCLAFTPRIVDLNNDGYKDIVAGQYNPGHVVWFKGEEQGFLPGEYLKQEGDPLVGLHQRDYSLPASDIVSSYYWTYSSVAFGDFDDDGDQDMIVGGSAIRLSENLGTKYNPKFGKRELLLDINGKPLVVHEIKEKERNKYPRGSENHEPEAGTVMTVPNVVDWDQDGVLDLLITDSYLLDGSAAIKFFKGVRTDKGLLFEPGIPLFSRKDGGKEFPGSWINVCVTDWNGDGINDLLIGTSVATINGKFNHELSWTWEEETEIIKKNPLYESLSTKEYIEDGIKSAEVLQEKLGLTDKEMKEKGYITKDTYLKNPKTFVLEAHKTLAHQGYVYVMLGAKRD